MGRRALQVVQRQTTFYFYYLNLVNGHTLCHTTIVSGQRYKQLHNSGLLTKCTTLSQFTVHDGLNNIILDGVHTHTISFLFFS